MVQMRGVLENINKDYSPPEREHLVRILAELGGNLYVWCKLKPPDTYKPVVGTEHWGVFLSARSLCEQHQIQFWVGLKPGSHNWSKPGQVHPDANPQMLLENAQRFVEFGADGIFLFADDTRGKKVSERDGPFHGFLVDRLARVLGDKFKGFCGEEYQGNLDRYPRYWEPIRKVMPTKALLGWTGPVTNSREITVDHVPQVPHPILLLDNFFRVYQVKPYRYRDPALAHHLAALLINLGPVYSKQYMAVYSGIKWSLDPHGYCPDAARDYARTNLKRRFGSCANGRRELEQSHGEATSKSAPSAASEASHT